jgi:hypothetical protein
MICIKYSYRYTMELTTNEHKEYIKLHYNIMQRYKKHYKHIPFRYINRTIKRRWSVIQYNKIMNQYDTSTQKTQTIHWSDDV